MWKPVIRLPEVTSPISLSLRRAALAGAVLVTLVPATAASAVEADPAAPQPAAELGLASDESVLHSQDHVLVQVDESAVSARSLSTVGEEVGGGWYEVPVPAGVEPIAWAEELATRPGVETAELDIVLEPQASPPFISPDPLYTNASSPGYQWHLHAVNVANAWLSTVGSGVTVAVLDTGVNNGGDGFCRPFVAEYNAFADVPGPGVAVDNEGHGSHVAGSVAQCSDNGIGGAGMAPEASIMPVKVLPDGSASTVARGIDWAVQNGAQVINMSIGCGDCTGSSTLNQAIERAAAAGVILVSSAGNQAIDVFYPANHPLVIAVGSTTRAGEVASYSARGSALDLVAPGGAPGAASGFVYQETSEGWVGMAGTSMASAHVSGAAALLISRFPGAPATRVRNALTCGASDMMASGRDDISGAGLLNAWASVEQLRLMTEANTSKCVGQPASHAPFVTVQATEGIWRLHRGPAQVATFYFGNPGDVGFMGDWDCDGIDTPGLYRQSDGYAYLRNSNSQGVADVSFFFGNPGDIPIAGDFDGDGCDTLSLYRVSEGRYYIINRLGSADRGLGRADQAFYFGNPGDTPFMGDWDGDGIVTPGLRRSSNGFVYLRHSNTQGPAQVEYFYGDPGDIVFTGDWDADGDDTLGLYRPATGAVYLRNNNSTGVAQLSVGVGFGMHVVGGGF
jgi:subtilisin family serine protease